MSAEKAVAIFVAVLLFLIEELVFGILSDAVMRFHRVAQADTSDMWSESMNGLAGGYLTAMLLATIAGVLVIMAKFR